VETRSSIKQLSGRRSPAKTTVFLGAEIGIGIRYFCQTQLLRELVARGLNVVVLAPNVEDVTKLQSTNNPSVHVERLRVDKLDNEFARGHLKQLRAFVYACVNYLRVAGIGKGVNRAVARDATMLVERRWIRTRARMRVGIPLLRASAWVLSNFRVARRLFESALDRRPLDRFHGEVFEKYEPSLVVTSTAGWWPTEEALLRESGERGIETLAVVTGWDHPSSKGIPAARPDRVAVWSEVHRSELVNGSDFDEKKVDICGPVHFDVYRDAAAIVPRAAYLERHNLDPSKRLITFGCSFVGLSPNFVIVKALAEALTAGELGDGIQLLVRLHPSHLKRPVGKYRKVRREADMYFELASQLPDVRIDSPLIGADAMANYTVPEDASGLASLFAHTDVFVTLFSTMVLESCFNDVPVVAAAFEPNAADVDDFLPISSALDWPTHSRIIQSGAASVARNSAELVSAVRRYLADPSLHARERRQFAEQECTFLDGKCAGRLAALMDGIAQRARLESVRVSSRRAGREYQAAQVLAEQ
jgi:hypothetical protein